MRRYALHLVALLAAAVVLTFWLTAGDGGGLDSPDDPGGAPPAPPDPIEYLPAPPVDRSPPRESPGGRPAGNGGTAKNGAEPERPLADLDTIRRLLRAERLEDAHTELDRILALEPENADALALRGEVQLARGWWTPAEADFAAAARIEEADADRLLVHAEALYRLNRYGPAEAQIRRALSLEPERARPHALLAVILLRQGDETAADKEIREAMRIDPEEPLTKKLAGRLEGR